jgi:hypothetical protein
MYMYKLIKNINLILIYIFDQIELCVTKICGIIILNEFAKFTKFTKFTK